MSPEKEAKSPGSIPKIFSSHPLTKDRVKKAQKEIAEILPDREEYVVTTSEFDRIKRRLTVMLAGRDVKKEDESRPSLRRKKRAKNDDDKDKKKDEPPVLRRRN